MIAVQNTYEQGREGEKEIRREREGEYKEEVRREKGKKKEKNNGDGMIESHTNSQKTRNGREREKMTERGERGDIILKKYDKCRRDRQT